MIEPVVYTDDRGYFMETYHKARYDEYGIAGDFVQDNHSYSTRAVLRGLHFQHPKSQGKLVWVVEGEIFDVAVDVRVGSPTFGCWAGHDLSARNHHQLYIPPGFAHGFAVLSDTAHVVYKCSAPYDRASDRTLLWRDAAMSIDWPVPRPILSAKDQEGRTLEDLRDAGDLPLYSP